MRVDIVAVTGWYDKCGAYLGGAPLLFRFRPAARGTFFFSSLLSILELSDSHVYEPYIRALLGTASLAPLPLLFRPAARGTPYPLQGYLVHAKQPPPP